MVDSTQECTRSTPEPPRVHLVIGRRPHDDDVSTENENESTSRSYKELRTVRDISQVRSGEGSLASAGSPRAARTAPSRHVKKRRSRRGAGKGSLRKDCERAAENGSPHSFSSTIDDAIDYFSTFVPGSSPVASAGSRDNAGFQDVNLSGRILRTLACSPKSPDKGDTSLALPSSLDGRLHGKQTPERKSPKHENSNTLDTTREAHADKSNTLHRSSQKARSETVTNVTNSASGEHEQAKDGSCVRGDDLAQSRPNEVDTTALLHGVTELPVRLFSNMNKTNLHPTPGNDANMASKRAIENKENASEFTISFPSEKCSDDISLLSMNSSVPRQKYKNRMAWSESTNNFLKPIFDRRDADQINAIPEAKASAALPIPVDRIREWINATPASVSAPIAWCHQPASDATSIPGLKKTEMKDQEAADESAMQFERSRANSILSLDSDDECEGQEVVLGNLGIQKSPWADTARVDGDNSFSLYSDDQFSNESPSSLSLLSPPPSPPSFRRLRLIDISQTSNIVKIKPVEHKEFEVTASADAEHSGQTSPESSFGDYQLTEELNEEYIVESHPLVWEDDVQNDEISVKCDTDEKILNFLEDEDAAIPASDLHSVAFQNENEQDTTALLGAKQRKKTKSTFLSRLFSFKPTRSAKKRSKSSRKSRDHKRIDDSSKGSQDGSVSAIGSDGACVSKGTTMSANGQEMFTESLGGSPWNETDQRTPEVDKPVHASLCDSVEGSFELSVNLDEVQSSSVWDSPQSSINKANRSGGDDTLESGKALTSSNASPFKPTNLDQTSWVANSSPRMPSPTHVAHFPRT